MSDKMRDFADLPREFVKEGTQVASLINKTDQQFVNRCTKPSKAEYIQLCRAIAVGFVVMGFIGYFVKLIHIPINNILVGGA